MNDELESQLLKVKDLILNNEVVIEYFKVKEEIKNNKYLMDLNEKVRLSQKEMSLAINDEKLYTIKKEEYLNLYNEYHNNPLINNYEYLKDEVYNLLSQIKDVLQ